MLAIDLGIFSKGNHEVSFREAALWSLAWITLALIFYAFLNQFGEKLHNFTTQDQLDEANRAYLMKIRYNIFEDFDESVAHYRNAVALEFITGYLIEYALSVDNIFIIILIFSSFKVRSIYYKKVLFWGIFGAIVMRFAFIFLGSSLIQQFEWVLYIFGGFLIITGIKMFFDNDDEDIDTANHPIVKFASKYLSVFPRFVGGKFFVKKAGVTMVTPLFMVLLIIEFTDLIFAVDSVPAVFSVTKDPYLVFFSNIFAILGLRSMFFFLANIMHLFHYLKVGLSVLLVFIGSKMLAHHWLDEHGFENYYSLLAILGILTISILASLIFPKKHDEPAVHLAKK